jgi:DNA-binding IclR family transcriptional regulator
MGTMFELFSDDDTRSLFETLASRKRSDLRGIREGLQLSEDKATEILERLVKTGLLEQVDGPVPDFNTYFLSAKGLAASRQLSAGQRLAKAL